MNYRGFDLGSYFNECFIDYTHPLKPNFKIYEEWLLTFFKESLLSNSEFEKLLKVYLTNFYTHHKEVSDDSVDVDSYVAHEQPLLKEQVYKGSLIQHLQWAFWCLLMMPDATTSDGVE